MPPFPYPTGTLTKGIHPSSLCLPLHFPEEHGCVTKFPKQSLNKRMSMRKVNCPLTLEVVNQSTALLFWLELVQLCKSPHKLSCNNDVTFMFLLT